MVCQQPMAAITANAARIKTAEVSMWSAVCAGRQSSRETRAGAGGASTSSTAAREPMLLSRPRQDDHNRAVEHAGMRPIQGGTLFTVMMDEVAPSMRGAHTLKIHTHRVATLPLIRQLELAAWPALDHLSISQEVDRASTRHGHTVLEQVAGVQNLKSITLARMDVTYASITEFLAPLTGLTSITLTDHYYGGKKPGLLSLPNLLRLEISGCAFARWHEFQLPALQHLVMRCDVDDPEDPIAWVTHIGASMPHLTQLRLHRRRGLLAADFDGKMQAALRGALSTLTALRDLAFTDGVIRAETATAMSLCQLTRLDVQSFQKECSAVQASVLELQVHELTHSPPLWAVVPQLTSLSALHTLQQGVLSQFPPMLKSIRVGSRVLVGMAHGAVSTSLTRLIVQDRLAMNFRPDADALMTRMPQLQRIDVDCDERMTRTLLQAAAAATRPISHVTLKNVGFGRECPGVVAMLSGVPGLRSVQLWGVALTREALLEVASLPHVRKIEVVGCGVGRDDCEDVERLTGATNGELRITWTRTFD